MSEINNNQEIAQNPASPEMVSLESTIRDIGELAIKNLDNEFDSPDEINKKELLLNIESARQEALGYAVGIRGSSIVKVDTK
jgi:hypothetical protein